MRKKTYLKLAGYQTEQAKQHLNEVRSIHSEMRGYKHDFHHHLQALKGQLEAGEVERAIAYIEELDYQLMNVDTLLKTGNVSLDAILSAKIAQAKAENIAVDVKASVPDSLTITDSFYSLLVRKHNLILMNLYQVQLFVRSPRRTGLKNLDREKLGGYCTRYSARV